LAVGTSGALVGAAPHASGSGSRCGWMRTPARPAAAPQTRPWATGRRPTRRYRCAGT